jgi:hypothetical protein
MKGAWSSVFFLYVLWDAMMSLLMCPVVLKGGWRLTMFHIALAAVWNLIAWQAAPVLYRISGIH